MADTKDKKAKRNKVRAAIDAIEEGELEKAASILRDLLEDL